MEKLREYYLYSVDMDKRVYTQIVEPHKELDKDAVREKIINHLNENPDDELEWTLVSNDTNLVGGDIIDFYTMYQGKPSKVIIKGDRNFHKSLNH